jgi:hypothetical protein
MIFFMSVQDFLALSPTRLDADICGESGPRKTSLTPHEFNV